MVARLTQGVSEKSTSSARTEYNRTTRGYLAYLLSAICYLPFGEVEPSRLLFAIRYGSNPLFEWMSAFHSSCLKLSLAVADAGVMGYRRHKLTFVNKRNCKRNSISRINSTNGKRISKGRSNREVLTILAGAT